MGDVAAHKTIRPGGDMNPSIRQRSCEHAMHLLLLSIPEDTSERARMSCAPHAINHTAAVGWLLLPSLSLSLSNVSVSLSVSLHVCF